MIAKVSGSGERTSAYEIPDNQMAAGSTLGSPKATLVIKATGAIEKFYSVDAGKVLIGTVVLHHFDDRNGVPLAAFPGEFIIHPEHQEHVFRLSNGITVREDIFLLSGKPHGRRVDPPAAYYTVTLTNDTDADEVISTYAAAQLRGETSHDVATAYSRVHRALLAWNVSDPDVVRVFGCSIEPSSYESTNDSGKPIRTSFAGKLNNTTLARAGDPVGMLHLRNHLKPGASASFSLRLSFSVKGRAAALRTYAHCPPAKLALEATHDYYEEILGRAVVITPDHEVNRGVLWAKANMLRTQVLADTGWCFVNDPTRSNNSVGRDTAWFAFGSDYITPQFSRESLLWYATHLEKRGMVVEYYDIRNGKSEDYGLNINDNTPLLILALWHHYTISGNLGFLKTVYPYALKAAHFILSQRNKQGLVWCTATRTSDWGIIGWRNVIQNYRLSGATTEVNSECYAALDTVARMAEVLQKGAESERFRAHAKSLRDAINTHLFDKETGLYYLNIDLGGHPRTDITSDLIFPVMFGVADEQTSAHIISRLSVTPRLAADWKWMGVRNLALAGENVTWFVVRAPDLKLYANFRFEQTTPYEAYDEDISPRVRCGSDAAVALALRRGRQVTIFVGNTMDRTITTAVFVNIKLDVSYAVRSYNSLSGDWVESPMRDARDLQSGFAVQLESKGFCIIELRKEAA